MKSLTTIALTLLIVSAASMGWTKPMNDDLKTLWNMDEFRNVPFDVEVVSTKEENGFRVDEMYFTSEITKNGPNRIFCCFARPIKPTKPVPIILLIHGGGGHADAATPLWAAQSNNAMVMSFDWSGEYIPGATNYTKWRMEYPDPYKESSRVVPTVKDNTLYHILVGLRRGLDYISQQPDADMTHVASFGGSWGGYLSLLLAGTDSRVGCVMDALAGGGWRGENSGLNKGIMELPKDQQNTYYATYDSTVYAHQTKACVVFCAASDDYFFWLGGLQKNYKAIPGKKLLVITPNCDHDVGGPKMGDTGWSWIRQYFTGKEAFPAFAEGSLRCSGRKYTWSDNGAKPAVSSKLYWSPGNGVWCSRYWLEVPAKKEGGKWSAEIPAEFADLAGEVFVNVFGEDNLAASSTTVSRKGLDALTAPGAHWKGNTLWDIASGAAAWRSYAYTHNILEVSPNGAIKLSPVEKQTHFAALTNSVILASAHAGEYAGIRLNINGEGKEGKMSVRLSRDTRSAKEATYEALVDYKAGETAVDLPWSAFKGPDGKSKLPYPFDGLTLEGDRADGSAITLTTVELYK